MTPIADMVQQMMAAGVAHDMIVLAIRTAELSACPPDSQVDKAADRRRAWDREYRRNKRMSTRNPPDIPPDTQNVPLIEEVKEVRTSDKKEEKKESKKEGRRKKVGAIPPDWKPPQRAFDLAAEMGLTVPPIEERFRDYLASSGKQYADYDAGFCNFVRNTPKFNGAQNGQRPRARPSGDDAVIAGFSRAFGFETGRGEVAGAASEEIPRGRFELDLEPESGGRTQGGRAA